jgi:large subunit ribosomal protein L21
MWDDIFKRWIDLLFWWVPRTEETRPERASESSPVASEQGASRVPEEALEQQVPTAEEVVPDDLTVIKGIGPAVQRKLRSLGITTFRDLCHGGRRRIGRAPQGLAACFQGAGP